MPRRTPYPVRTKPGRPNLLTPDTVELLERATKAGVGSATAAAAANISVKTFERWLTRGRLEVNRLIDAEDDGVPAVPDPAEAPYVELLERIEKARAARAMFAMQAITKAAQGGAITEESTETYTDESGNLITRRTVKKTAPDWRAAAWYLERRERPDFGKDTARVEVTGADGEAIKVEHGVDLDAVMALAARVRANQQEITGGAETDSTRTVIQGEIVT